MRKIYIFLFLILFFLFPKSSFADNFSTDYSVEYLVQASSNTNVRIDVSLTNLTDNYYASSYDISLGFKDIKNLTASDNEGAISPEVNVSNIGTKVHLPLNSKVVGLGNKLTFHISFDTDQIAKKLGNVWDVNIPGISKQNNFANFQTLVTYPSLLGKPVFIKPNLPNIVNQSSSSSSISFTKEDLGTAGISMAFGNYQNYNFNLTYHLSNTNVFPTETEIALPASTNYQDVYIDNISPRPSNVYIDNDGNWLAKILLPPSKKMDVNVKGFAKIYLTPKKVILTKEKEKKYLSQENYWEVNNPKIIELAKRLKTPREIYNYVVDNLHYDFSRVENNLPRLGAASAIQNPNSAVCLEFTDLFIAISRAAGIPAREINGFAYTDNNSQRPLSLIKDVLHAWPEYYDFEKSTWIMVDPTWGNTTGGIDYFDTLDFDHFAFVINGVDSSYPIPAGGYKLPQNLNSKDVDISIGEGKTIKAKITSKIILNNTFPSALPIEGKVEIKNIGHAISSPSKLLISSNSLAPYNIAKNISQIPPFGSVTIPLAFDKTDVLTNKQDTIKIQSGESTYYKTISIYPFFLSHYFILGGILFVSILLIIPAAYAGARRLSFLRQQRGGNLLRESKESSEKSI